MPLQQTMEDVSPDSIKDREFPVTDDMTQLLLLGKVEYGGGPIFKVVQEC